MKLRYPVSKRTQGIATDGEYVEPPKERSFYLSLGNILPCPFCASDNTEIHENHRDNVVYVECGSCGSSGKRFYYKPLVSFTYYTIDDFRNNPILRAQVEEEYFEYKKSIELEAVKAWNIRKLDNDDL